MCPCSCGINHAKSSLPIEYADGRTARHNSNKGPGAVCGVCKHARGPEQMAFRSAILARDLTLQYTSTSEAAEAGTCSGPRTALAAQPLLLRAFAVSTAAPSVASEIALASFSAEGLTRGDGNATSGPADGSSSDRQYVILLSALELLLGTCLEGTMSASRHGSDKLLSDVTAGRAPLTRLT